MINLNKFRFRIGDKIKTEDGIYTILAYFFSEVGNFNDLYGYTIDRPCYEASAYSFDEEGNHIVFPYFCAEYIIESSAIELVSSSCSDSTIKISLSQAQQWYKSDNAELKDLALQAFRRDQLEDRYTSVFEHMQKSDELCCVTSLVPKEEEERVRATNKLRIIAKHLNDGWQKTYENMGYYLVYSENCNGSLINFTDKITINHDSFLINNVIYFKSCSLAREAANMMGSDIYKLF